MSALLQCPVNTNRHRRGVCRVQAPADSACEFSGRSLPRSVREAAVMLHGPLFVRQEDGGSFLFAVNLPVDSRRNAPLDDLGRRQPGLLIQSVARLSHATCRKCARSASKHPHVLGPCPSRVLLPALPARLSPHQANNSDRLLYAGILVP